MNARIGARNASANSTGDLLGSPLRQVGVAVVASACVLCAWIVFPQALLPVVLPVGLFGFVVAATWPAELSIVFLTLTYFKLNELSPMLAPMAYALSAGSALVSFALVWHLLFARTVRPDLRGPHALVAIFWLFVTVGVVTAQDHAIAVTAWTDYSKTLLLALAVLWFINTAARLRLLFRLFVIGGVVVSIATVVNGWNGLGLVEGTRAVAGNATLSNPNDLALILLLPLAFGAISVLSPRHWTDRLLGSVGVLATSYAIVLTQSRGGLLGFLAVFAVIGSRYVRSKLVLAGVGVGLALALYAMMGIADRESGGDADLSGDSAQDRIYAWHAGVNMAKAYPLTGVGIGNFVTQFTTYSPEEVQHPITAHSIWFLVLGETGIPGLLTFLTLIATCLGACAGSVRRLAAGRAPRDLQGIALATLAALAGYLVAGSFLSYVFQWPLYVLVAMIVALRRLADAADPGAGAPTPD